MTFVILAIAGVLVWKNWAKISGFLKKNGTDLGAVTTPPTPRPSPLEEDAMRFYHQAGRAASGMLRDKYPQEYDRYVNEWIKEHSQS